MMTEGATTAEARAARHILHNIAEGWRESLVQGDFLFMQWDDCWAALWRTMPRTAKEARPWIARKAELTTNRLPVNCPDLQSKLATLHTQYIDIAASQFKTDEYAATWDELQLIILQNRGAQGLRELWEDVRNTTELRLPSTLLPLIQVQWQGRRATSFRDLDEFVTGALGIFAAQIGAQTTRTFAVQEETGGQPTRETPTSRCFCQDSDTPKENWHWAKTCTIKATDRYRFKSCQTDKARAALRRSLGITE